MVNAAAVRRHDALDTRGFAEGAIEDIQSVAARQPDVNDQPVVCKAAQPVDGIGQEVTPEARKVLQVVGKATGASFEFEPGLVGGAAIDATGGPLPEATLKLCKQSQAILFGSVGGPKWDNVDQEVRPERAVVKGWDRLGVEHEREGTGLLARAFQHEMDHLDGTGFVDRLRGIKRDLIVRKIRKLTRAGKW